MNEEESPRTFLKTPVKERNFNDMIQYKTEIKHFPHGKRVLVPLMENPEQAIMASFMTTEFPGNYAEILYVLDTVLLGLKDHAEYKGPNCAMVINSETTSLEPVSIFHKVGSPCVFQTAEVEETLQQWYKQSKAFFGLP